jgi:NAD(P)-dependent dehydrogenase (short-subunit alcohol dehydrogenase family)
MTGAHDDLFADQRLDGRVVAVTGSTQGLGAEIATRAAALGAAGVVATPGAAPPSATASRRSGPRRSSSPATWRGRKTAARSSPRATSASGASTDSSTPPA